MANQHTKAAADKLAVLAHEAREDARKDFLVTFLQNELRGHTITDSIRLKYVEFLMMISGFLTPMGRGVPLDLRKAIKAASKKPKRDGRLKENLPDILLRPAKTLPTPPPAPAPTPVSPDLTPDLTPENETKETNA